MSEPRFLIDNAALFALADGLEAEARIAEIDAKALDAQPNSSGEMLRRRASRCRGGAIMVECLARLDPQVLRALADGSLGLMLSDMRARERRERLKAVG
jgi:hypothetical protein